MRPAAATFDVTVAAFSLTHLVHPSTGLREAARVTRAGGAVIASAYAATLSQSIAKVLGRNMDGPGFKFLLSHSSMDQEHVAKLNALVKTISDPEAQEAIVNATRVNFYQFGRTFYEGGFTSLIA